MAKELWVETAMDGYCRAELQRILICGGKFSTRVDLILENTVTFGLCVPHHAYNRIGSSYNNYTVDKL